MKLRIPYALKEGGHRDFAISTTKFTGNGKVEEIHWATNSGVPPFELVAGTEESRPADLVLLAMGFLGPEKEGMLAELGVKLDERTNVAVDANKQTSIPGVFAAGDMSRGQSLIVWAIQEGRAAARGVDQYLMGETLLP
jgi:glutamate synthase (NADPH/NADH) small chain